MILSGRLVLVFVSKEQNQEMLMFFSGLFAMRGIEFQYFESDQFHRHISGGTHSLCFVCVKTNINTNILIRCIV